MLFFMISCICNPIFAIAPKVAITLTCSCKNLQRNETCPSNWQKDLGVYSLGFLENFIQLALLCNIVRFSETYFEIY